MTYHTLISAFNFYINTFGIITSLLIYSLALIASINTIKYYLKHYSSSYITVSDIIQISYILIILNAPIANIIAALALVTYYVRKPLTSLLNLKLFKI